MNQSLDLSERNRLVISGLTAVTGGVTALAITQFGGGMLNHLPDSGFHLAAFVGAGIAGFILADGLGRPGVGGGLLGLVTVLLLTLSGAWLGAALLSPTASIEIGFLGWIALIEASAHPLVLKIWAVLMLFLNLKAAGLRAKQDQPSP